MTLFDTIPNPLLHQNRAESMVAFAFMIADVHRTMFLQIETIVGNDNVDARIVSGMVSFRFHGMKYISQKWLRIPSLILDIVTSNE